MKWKTEKRKIDELHPFHKNPRSMTEKGMKDLGKSLDKFDVADPMVINTDGTIIGGHARYMALQGKADEVDCRVPDRKLTEKEVEELNIRLNKNIAGEWDYDILGNQWEIDDLKEYGFEDNELGLNDIDFDGGDEDEPEEPQRVRCPKCGHIFEPKAGD